jgi:hypothetical protein
VWLAIYAYLHTHTLRKHLKEGLQENCIYIYIYIYIYILSCTCTYLGREDRSGRLSEGPLGREGRLGGLSQGPHAEDLRVGRHVTVYAQTMSEESEIHRFLSAGM